MYSMTVMKGNDEEALWTPSRVPTTNTANDGDSNPPPSVPVVMPMSWQYSTIESIMADLRTNEETYTFVLTNFAGCVVGMNNWKDDALSGAKKPSAVMSISSEAQLLLILLNYCKAWEAEANQPPASSSEDTSSSSVLGFKPLYRKQCKHHSLCTQARGNNNNNNSTKDGWSAEGICHFKALMTSINEDQNSDHGKEFETKFQTQMRACQEAQRSRKR
jgi:hypothetical protein